MHSKRLTHFRSVLLFVSVTCYLGNVVKAANNNRTHPQTKRQQKLFSLFNVVSFGNLGCVSTFSLAGSASGTSFRNGTCYTASECANKGGVTSGKCAAGFGVCCVFVLRSSGSVVTQNCTYIINPGFPDTYASLVPLTYAVQKSKNDVCMLRLDFESFSLLGTTLTTEVNGGACVDAFDVSVNTNQVIPQICGLNTGQHMYIDIGNQPRDSAVLSFSFGGSDSIGRTWDIKVTQIDCSSNNSPPEGCLQYETGLSGRISTFNFLPTNDNHLANQDYSVCIRRELGFCCVEFSPCSDPNSFSLSAVRNGAKTAATDTLCTLDFVGIPASSALCIATQSASYVVNRYCGPFLNTQNAATNNGPVCTCSAPFTVLIHTNALSDVGTAIGANTAPSRGTCLTWVQIPCTQ